MTLYDLNERADLILKKYEKYDSEAKQKNAGKNLDAFSEEFEELAAEIDKLMGIAAEVALEGNRAAVAAKNAEIRRVKTVLLTDGIDSLQKLVKKGKGINKPIIKDRQMRVQELIERIYAIPDGMSSNTNKRPTRYNKLDKNAKKNPVMIGMSDEVEQHLDNNPLYWKDTEETQQFAKTWEERKRKQDEALDRIDHNVSLLKEVATNMGEAIDRQDPVIDDIEAQITKATANIKTNNIKLKGLVHKMANARNFCVDVILVVVLLAIGAYMYSMFKPT